MNLLLDLSRWTSGSELANNASQRLAILSALSCIAVAIYIGESVCIEDCCLANLRRGGALATLSYNLESDTAHTNVRRASSRDATSLAEWPPPYSMHLDP